jgi:hypothetical protein
VGGAHDADEEYYPIHHGVMIAYRAAHHTDGVLASYRPGSRAAGIAIAFKRIESVQARRRAVNAPRPVALVRAGAIVETGKRVERADESGGDVPSRAEALAWAAKIAVACRCAQEVRELMPDPNV